MTALSLYMLMFAVRPDGGPPHERRTNNDQ